MKTSISITILVVLVFLGFTEIFAKNVIINNTSNVTSVNDSSSSVNTGINLGNNNSYGIRGNGKIETFKRELSSFERIKLSLPFDISIVCGNKNEAEIIIDRNLINYIKTVVSNNCLTLKTTENFSTQNNVKIILYCKDLNSLNVSSSGTISVSNINSENFLLDVTGACDITLTGNANNITINSEGASTINARNAKAKNLNIAMSGAGSAKVYASGKLNVQIHGAADIEYYGNPHTIDKNHFFAGSLEAGK